jgi:hypothetical protein
MMKQYFRRLEHSDDSSAGTVSSDAPLSCRAGQGRGSIKHAILFLVLLCVTSLSAQERYWGETFKTVSSCRFEDGGSITLEKKIDPTKYRVNPDGTKFYATTLAIQIQSKETARSIIETDAYTTAHLDKAMTPCMLIDPDKNVVCIFTNSKDSGASYGMDGFAYLIDINTKKWTKELVFRHANFGWFSFFGGSDKGNPELCHFSFAGYYSILSKRNWQGQWAHTNMGSINPNTADKQYSSHKNILIASRANVDKMHLQDNDYSSSSSSSSSSPSYYFDDKDVALAAGVVGTAAIFYGLFKLFTSVGSSDDSYGGSSGSYSSGSSGSGNSGSSSGGGGSNICDNIETNNIPDSDAIKWIKCNDLVDCCEIEFVDGVTGWLYRSRESGKKYHIPYVDVISSNLYYDSDENARRALYIYKKCPAGFLGSANWRETGQIHP